MDPQCPYTLHSSNTGNELTLHCRNCPIGTSSLTHPQCTTHILRLLRKNPQIKQLTLSSLIVTIIKDEGLEILNQLAQFSEYLNTQFRSQPPEIKQTNLPFDLLKELEEIQEESKTSPYQAFIKLRTLHQRLTTLFDYDILGTIIQYSPLNLLIPANPPSFDEFIRTHILLFIRPSFISTYLQLTPPPDAVFEKQYSIQDNAHHQDITHYQLT